MLNSFLGAAAVGELEAAVSKAAARMPVRTRANGFMAQPSLLIRRHRVEDWQEPSTPILATEVSRAFVPPWTRADTAAQAAALGPVAPKAGAGTLATNSSNSQQLPCQRNSLHFRLPNACRAHSCGKCA